MKIRPKIPIYLGGAPIEWYSKLSKYDPKNYLPVWAPERGLIAGDTSNGILKAWDSRKAGVDPGRYTPTYLKDYNLFGTTGSHYKYALSVEGQPNYRNFRDAMFDQETGNITDLGMEWVKQTDELLPLNHPAKLLNPDGTFKNSITVKLKDAHHRAPKTTTFNPQNPQELKAYIDWVMGDLTIGGRHNIFLLAGKRYFYKDKDGVEHWVNPEEIGNYTVSTSPVRETLDGIVTWQDYELTGLKSPNTPPSETPQLPQPEPKKENGGTEIGGNPEGDKNPQNTPNNGLLDRLRGIIPGLLSTGRLAGNLINNARVYDEALKGIRPTLLLPYYTHRQVVGDEAIKQAYYRRAAAGLTKAAQPFTSDADRQMAYMLEARRVGDELRAQGDLADNQEIRRTSDESNQHQWANTQRATEVANTNLASLNDANEKKHTLLALKHSAQWSSIDNYLKEIETRKRLLMEEDNAYNKLIDLLTYQTLLENDPELKEVTNELYALRGENGLWNESDPRVREAREKLKKVQTRILLENLRNYRDINRKYSSPLFFIKSGSKITYKKDDKLLYKSTKDIVDHFRRMCRRYPEKERKIQPLAPHPDGTRRRKYQVGGQFLAPFTIYTPAVGAGETARTISLDSTGTSSKATSSSKDTSSKDVLDLIKMFKDLKGVKVDVSSIYSTLSGVLQESEIFGKELNSLLIATMYLRAMLQLNNVSRSKEIYDKAYEVASANGALNEIAVDSVGNYAVLNKETGKIETVDKIDTSKHIPLTNSQLLTLREYRPDLAFDKGDYVMLNVVANGIGLPKIGLEIKALAGKLGNSELKLDGMSEVESNLVKQGIKLLQGAPDGYYKTTTETKNQLALKLAAINYIMQMLPENYKAVLDIHGGAKNLIPTFLSSQIEDSLTVSFSPLTGKAASDKSGVNSSSSKGGADNSAGLAFVLGQGPREIVDFNTGTSVAIRALGIRGTILNHSQENLGLGSTLQDVSKSQFSFLKLGQATFGGSRLNPGAYSHIMLNDSEIMGVDLPYKVDLNGNTVPDFLKCKLIEKADEIISQQNITDPNKINEIYLSVGLPPKYNQNGELNTQKYMRFAAILVTLDEQALLNKEAVLSDEVLLAGDVERDLYKEAMKKSNKDYSLGNGMWLTGWWKDELYKGTIFIPYDEDVAFAAVSSGRPMKQNLPDNASTVQLMLYAPKSLNYKPQDVTLSQIINN